VVILASHFIFQMASIQGLGNRRFAGPWESASSFGLWGPLGTGTKSGWSRAFAEGSVTPTPFSRFGAVSSPAKFLVESRHRSPGSAAA
jgi:hypothetical protein